MSQQIREVDPGGLRLPPSRASGADLWKLHMSESETRAALFAAFRELSESIPKMRAGQLMAAVGELCADLHGRGLWEASDAELLEAVWQFRRDFEASPAASSRQEV